LRKMPDIPWPSRLGVGCGAGIPTSYKLCCLGTPAKGRGHGLKTGWSTRGGGGVGWWWWW
jgi:hypothetical protein